MYCGAVDSQLQNEHNVRAGLIHIMQGDDVGVLELLQNIHLPLYLLPSHPPPAGPALALLNKFCSKLQACALLLGMFDNGKLPAVDTRQTKDIRADLSC